MKKIFTFVIVLITYNSFAQIELDLSAKITTIQSVNSQTITSIKLKNVLPNNKVYTVNATVKHISIPPLYIPTGENGFTSRSAVSIPDVCQRIIKLTKILDDETDESKIPTDTSNLHLAIKSLTVTDAANCASYVTDANNKIAATTITIPVNITIGKNDELNITVSRADNKWSFTYKNEQPNHWTTYYGFTYIPDVFTKFPNYYANHQADSFIITKMNGTHKNVLQNVSPTAMFTYRFFGKKPDAVFKFGLTGGIFYNTDILGAMFGPSLVIGDNITLNTGVSFIQKYKLKGQYREGQAIQDNLDFDQLHDKIWTYDMFISIGFNIPQLFKKSSVSTANTPSTQ